MHIPDTVANNQQGGNADKSYFSSPPAVSLPKGGGAIKGIGEKFAANPVTGTGSMTVPIAISPSRSGFGPQLSLAYDSGAGNGMFGLGWNLSLPSITRKTDKGLPRYWDTEESDVFILSGAEDLVPVLKSDGMVDEILRDGYSIRKYRPRIEGLFARIERWTKLDSGETHWRSISKDNITTLYGKTTESRIADPDRPTHIFSWLICESYDDKGNAIVYGYKSEDPEKSVGIDLAQAHEWNRSPKSRATNRYLKRIEYGNRTPRQAGEDLNQRSDWMFEVVFDYGEHDRTNPIPKDPEQWTIETIRKDPFSSYRAGFEVRTYRLCQRVLMFHHFPDEPEVGRDCLVRSLDLTYSYEQNPSDVRNPIYSLLLSVMQTGYKRNPAGGYIQKSLPPLEFTYSEANIDETVRDVDRESLENLPYGLDGTRYQWVDLDGEGISGILTEQGNGWFYKRNLSPVNAVRENGKSHVEAQFSPVELVTSKPASGLADGAQFLDLAGDGQPDLVTLRGATPGFYERTQDAGWENFVAFKSLPVLDWDNPNLKFIDLDGDGHADILISEDDCFVWHRSLAENGFAAAERVYQPWDEEKGPRVIFADSTQSIHLADMSGDGLTDIVRIRIGEVCYWPNLGYGRFGAKVTMDNPPWYDAPDIFNQRRIQLADIDGSGTTDILYLSGSGVQVYFNQSGNGWAAKRTLSYFPAIDSVAAVAAIDLLGNGTACLVWSSSLPGDARRAMRYIDLIGGQKPYLLVKTASNMGAETVVEYAPSTKFYLQDKLAGTPWITKLPFPVHVVERVETYDRVSGNRFVSRYAYHHGYFDGVEREFRGFGRVDRWDTEGIGTIQAEDTSSDSTNLDAASFVPPVLTKTWLHTGAYLDGQRISQQFEHEYYREPGESDRALEASLLPDTILPAGLTVEEEREAVRSLKESILRQEIYALDGSDKQPHPYSVSERNYEIRLEQALQTNRHAVFFAHDRETIDYHYERNPADPRITHAMTLEVDGFGNGLKSVAIAYPRRIPEFLEQGQIEGQTNQGKPFITYTENQVTNKPSETDWYRIGVPIETRTYEITGLEVTGLPSFVPFTLDFIRNKLKEIETRLQAPNSTPKPEIDYEEVPDGSLQRRLIERVRSLYRKDNEANTTDPMPLPLGEVESLALPCESFKLAFTPGLLTQVYSSKIAAGDLNTLLANDGKYVQLADVPGQLADAPGWWIPSGRLAFEPDKFYLPTKIKDPFGGISTMTYDRYLLLVIESRDALPDSQTNITRIRNDYRVMQPQEITDPNENRSQVAFDALGMVVGTTAMGKDKLPREGDSFDNFSADLTPVEIKAFFDTDDPRSLAINYLGTATTGIIYDLERVPVCAAAIARKKHVSDLAGQPLTLDDVQVSFVYSDGFGREAQTKVQAEPGPLDPNVLNSPTLNPRWVGTGTKVYNNKGKPVRQYEPFFSPDHKFGIEQQGVSSTLFYDPMERVVATLHPNHTWEKVVFDAWQQKTYDVNDTVLNADGTTNPKLDEDVKGFFSRLPNSDYLPTWYEQRIIRAAGDPERVAAEKTAIHRQTPTIAHFDTLGRPFLTVAQNRFERNGAIVEEPYLTRVVLDIEGNQRKVIDARGNRVMRYDYDLLGHVMHSHSMDAGDRWMLNNVAGHPIRSWDSRGHEIQYQYDVLQRPTHLFVQQGNALVLAERIVYGENHSEAQQRNLKGKVFQHYDSAGAVSNWEFDFKGNLLRSSRQIALEHHAFVNWSALATLTEISDLIAAAKPLLEPRVYAASTRYDALNRPTYLTTPDNSVMHPIYNEANLLEAVDVNLKGEQQNGSPLWIPFVKNIDYNAKGQRILIQYGNDVVTTYEYDDKTFRLMHLKSDRGNAFPGDKPKAVQNLFYTYDPVGNITAIRDAAQQTIFFANAVVEPVNQYQYDALYRLIQATGREHIGQAVDPSREFKPERKPAYDYNDFARSSLPHPNDIQAMRDYTQFYQYDGVGNILQMLHQATGSEWHRDYVYDTTSNRLLSTTVPGLANQPQTQVSYEYDEHGNMSQMPHLQLMRWDFKDQLHASAQQVRNNGGTPETTYYVYDASGQRVRKITERQADAGQTPKRKSERIYLGGYEIYREYNGDGTTVTLERETLHIMDDKQRIALVETRTQGNDNSPRQLSRYQLGNHLGSATLELDGQGAIISYEEYYPYGSTSYQAGRSGAEVGLKRYRYTGKERDEETGLYYHGARYYASWLGRWTSCDPIGIGDGLNLYRYTSNNPISYTDTTGTQQKAVCSIDPNHPAAVICTPVPDKPAEPPIEEVTVRGAKRGSKERQAELKAMQGDRNSTAPPQFPTKPTNGQSNGIPLWMALGHPEFWPSQVDPTVINGFNEGVNRNAIPLVGVTALAGLQLGILGGLEYGSAALVFGRNFAGAFGNYTGLTPLLNGFRTVASILSSSYGGMGFGSRLWLAMNMGAAETMGWGVLGGGAFAAWRGGTATPTGSGRQPNPFANLTNEEIDTALSNMSSDFIYRTPVSATEAGHAVESMVPISRWGRPGLQPGDWVMSGPPTSSNFFRSFKWDPNPTNMRIPFSEAASRAEGYMVPPSHVTRPTGWGLDGWWKSLFGQRKYTPTP